MKGRRFCPALLAALTAVLLAALLSLAAWAAPGDESGGEASVWDAIRALEEARLNAAGEEARTALACSEDFYTGLFPEVETIVTARADYVPGTVFYHKGGLFWETTDGVANGYFPSLRAEHALEAEETANAEPLSDAELAELEQILSENEGAAELMSFDESAHYDTAFFSPNFGKSVGPFHFNQETFYKIQEIANWTGGNYEAYFGADATVERLASALQDCCVVVVNTHGCVGGFELARSAALTAADWKKDENCTNGNYYHAVLMSDDIVVVDAHTIINHMTGPAAGGLLILGCCHSMEDDSLERPLRDAGVGTVFGYSRSVQHNFDDMAMEEFLTAISRGNSIARASQYMRERLVKRTGLADRSAVYWDPWCMDLGDYFCRTEAEAREHGKAFIWITSDADPYPTGEYGTQCKQAVTSTWTVPRRPTAGTQDIEIAAPVGTEFKKYFGNAWVDKVEGTATLLHPEQIPATVCTGVTQFNLDPVIGYDKTVYYSFLTGVFTFPGYWESEVELLNGSGQREIRKIRLMAYSEEPSDTVEMSTAYQIGSYYLAWKVADSETYQVDLLDGSLPEGAELYRSKNGALVKGYPRETGVFTSRWRVIYWNGTTEELQLTLTITDEPAYYNQTITERAGQPLSLGLETGDGSGVYFMEMIDGAFPPGVSMRYSQSEAPCITGQCDTPGEYTVKLRIVTGRFKTIIHTIRFSFYWTADKYKNLDLDLTGGTAYLTAAQYERVWNGLLYASNSGQIAANKMSFDLDKDGSLDLRLDRNFSSVTLLYGNSLEEDALYFKPDEATRKLLHDAGIADWYEQLALYLTEFYPLIIDGTMVTSRNRRDVLNNGVFSFDGLNTLTVRGSYAGETDEPLIAQGFSDFTVRVEENVTLSAKDTGILCRGRTTVTGPGLLYLKAGGAGILCSQWESGKPDLTLSDATVRIEAGTTALLCGDGSSCTLTFDHAEVKLKGGTDAAGGFGSIRLFKTMLKPLSDCRIDGGAFVSGSSAAKAAELLAYDEAYGLTVDGVEVTDRNRNDVLNNGVFLFDGTDTLYVKGSYSGSGRIVASLRPELNVVFAPNITLSSSGVCTLGFYGCEAVLSGGPVTLKNTRAVDGAAILLGHNGTKASKLTVDEMTLDIECTGRGIDGVETGTEKHAVTIDHSNMDIRAESSCVNLYGSFVWNDCDLTGGLVHTSSGVFMLDDPEDGARPASHAVFTANRHYDLWIEGTQVGDANCADVLGDGTFAYDPLSRTLTVKQDHASPSSMLWSEVQGLTVYIERDLKLENDDMMTGTLLSFAGDTAIRGPGRLTLVSPRDCLTVTDGAVLRIETPALDARSEMYCAVRGANGGERLVLSGAELSAVGCADPYGYSGGVTGFTGGIDPGSCAVTEPEGGYVDPVSGSVVDPASGKPAETVRILPVWRYDRSSGSLQIALASGEWPVWAASYDASGRFLGLVRITAPGGYPVSGLLKAGGDHLKIFRADTSTWVPDCAAETIYP